MLEQLDRKLARDVTRFIDNRERIDKTEAFPKPRARRQISPMRFEAFTASGN